MSRPITREDEQLVREALVHLTAVAPFHAQLLMNYPVKASRQAATAGVLIRRDRLELEIWVNPDFLRLLDTTQRPAVLAHEAEHIVRAVRARTPSWEDDDVLLFNVAQDFVINASLDRINMLRGFETITIDKMLNGQRRRERAIIIPCDRKALTMTEEEIFRLLKENKDKVLPQMAPCMRNGGDGDDGQQMEGVVTDVTDFAGDEAVAAEPLQVGNLPEELRQRVEQDIAASAAAVPEKLRGSLPGAAKEILEKLRKLRPSVDWRRLLARFLSEYGMREDWTYAQPNRHDLARGGDVVMPAITHYGLDTLGVCIDTSGSMSNRLIEEGLAELALLLRHVRPRRIVVIEADSEVQKVHELDGMALRDFHLPEVHGRGGTLFGPALETLTEYNPTCCVYFTDGYGENPKPPAYPVIWLLEGDYCSADFGTKVKLEPARR